MPPPPERRWPHVLAGYLFLSVLVLAAAVPIYSVTDPAYRPAVVRLAACVVVAVALLHAASAARATFEEQPPSEFERALEPPAAGPVLDPRFVALRDEIRFSAADRRYFERVLWPRLEALAASSDRTGRGIWPAMPRGRRLGRGPSLATLNNMIARLEERT